jgi:hypothetical protein
MTKITSLSKFKKASLVLVLALGILAFFAITKQQKLQSQSALVFNQETDDDEPLSTSCGGVERWSVKVMTDASAGNLVLTPKNSSVTHIVGLTTPTPTTSMPRYDQVEDSVYTVLVNITEMRVESDSDWHLVITDGKSTMIAECPCPSCNSVIASPYISEFTTARNWIAANIGNVQNTSLNVKNVLVTGQAFLDPPHGQSGAAPNNVELHSILKIQWYVPTGVDNINETASANVYPNPTMGLFNVDLTSQNKATIAVYNMVGQQVYEGPLSSGNNKVDIQGKASGLYIYKILSETGDVISDGKILKQ